MQGSKKITVDENEYEFWYLDPFKSADLLMKISNKILKPIGAAFGGISDLEGIAEQKVDFKSAFMSLADNLNSDTTAIIRELLSVVHLGTGMELQPDVQFRGRVLHMFNVAFESFKYNYSDFLAEKSGVIGKIRRTLSQVLQTSSGSSGDPSSQKLPRSLKSQETGR